MTAPLRTIAIFDFDSTLVRGDSMWPFLLEVESLPKVVMALTEASLRCLWQQPKDKRLFIKDILLRRILAGKRITDIAPALARLKQWPEWLPTLNALREHYDAGHHVVIASGGLNLYLPALLEQVPHHALICTEIEAVDGIITGAMKNGNCVRQRKAELVAAYMANQDVFQDSWGYGNYPHDMPMLALVRQRVIV